MIVRVPLRLTLAGEHNRFSQFYAAYGGHAISASIDRHCYVVADERSDGRIRLESADYHVWDEWTQGVLVEAGEPLQVAKAALERFADRGLCQTGVELILASDAPPGTGLGASSAMAVALVHALAGYLGISMSTEDVAELAGWIEVERLGTETAKHDHFVSAFGGINAVSVTADGMSVRGLAVPEEMRRSLSHRLLLFWSETDESRLPSAAPSNNGLDDEAIIVRCLHNLNALAEEMQLALLDGDVDTVGMLLDLSWHYRRLLRDDNTGRAPDQVYQTARAAGAIGGRSMGKGGLLLYVAPERQSDVRRAMSVCGLREIPFNLETQGAQLLSSAHRSLDPPASDMPAAPLVLVKERVTRAETEPVYSSSMATELMQ